MPCFKQAYLYSDDCYNASIETSIPHWLSNEESGVLKDGVQEDMRINKGEKASIINMFEPTAVANFYSSYIFLINNSGQSVEMDPKPTVVCFFNGMSFAIRCQVAFSFSTATRLPVCSPHWFPPNLLNKPRKGDAMRGSRSWAFRIQLCWWSYI